jgi:hypothetical protein
MKESCDEMWEAARFWGARSETAWCRREYGWWDLRIYVMIVLVGWAPAGLIKFVIQLQTVCNKQRMLPGTHPYVYL